MQHVSIEKCREQVKQGVAWLMREEHQRKARALGHDINKAFTQHPHDAGETYWQHLWFTSSMSARFLYTTVLIMIHGLFPFLLTRAASEATEETYRIMKTRIPKSRREALDAGDDYSV